VRFRTKEFVPFRCASFQLLLPNAVAIAGGIFQLLPVQDVDVACV
jgi:hypothetical protein